MLKEADGEHPDKTGADYPQYRLSGTDEKGLTVNIYEKVEETKTEPENNSSNDKTSPKTDKDKAGIVGKGKEMVKPKALPSVLHTNCGSCFRTYASFYLE